MASLRPPEPARATAPGPVLCIAGPTASGKSAAAMAVARHLGARGLPVEIISVDSALVYRGMDIGTAKPTRAERDAVPHHLIDIIEPTHSYSAASFVRDTHTLVAAIHGRGACALLVGGTMMYFKALFDGLDDLPAADPAIRAGLDEQARQLGWPALHAELARVDPVTAARLAPNDSQRIQRALEVYRATGMALSAHHTRPMHHSAGQATHAGVSWPLLSLEPQNRAWLHERIAARFDQMLAQGLLDEVRRLRARGDLSPALPSMRCVGYRQAWEALDTAPGADATAAMRTQVRERGIAATRQLAKRQLTWLRSMPGRHVVACDDPQATQAVLDWVDSQPCLSC